MDELTEQVNLALDRVRADHGLTSDQQLAEHLGTYRINIARWRAGKYSDQFASLMPISVLAGTPLPSLRKMKKDTQILAPLLAMPKIDA